MRDDILSLKFHDKPRIARELAESVSMRLFDSHLADGMNVITWAPTTSSRKMTRGYDQAELLARHLGVFLDMPVKNLIRRVSKTSQSGLQRVDRLKQPVFVAKPSAAGKRIVVIDDVTTTGATFRAAAQALADVGCLEVLCVAPSWKP